jgi:hypothetical protein
VSDYWQQQRHDDAYYAQYGRLPGQAARILVTGSREFRDTDLARRALAEAKSVLPGKLIVVHGGARGADRLVAELARDAGRRVEAWPADWSLGKGAGFIRNQAMVNAGAAVCIALLVEGEPCRGTRDCARRAEAAGIAVRWYIQEVATR